MPFNITNGIHQGGVLSPVLLGVSMNNPMVKLNSRSKVDLICRQMLQFPFTPQNALSSNIYSFCVNGAVLTSYNCPFIIIPCSDCQDSQKYRISPPLRPCNVFNLIKKIPKSVVTLPLACFDFSLCYLNTCIKVWQSVKIKTGFPLD